jgi:hypothetical protein
LPEALAASISRFSRSEIDAMTNSPPLGERHPCAMQGLGLSPA